MLYNNIYHIFNTCYKYVILLSINRLRTNIRNFLSMQILNFMNIQQIHIKI